MTFYPQRALAAAVIAHVGTDVLAKHDADHLCVQH